MQMKYIAMHNKTCLFVWEDYPVAKATKSAQASHDFNDHSGQLLTTRENCSEPRL